jgi:hypothetical protein
MQVNARNRQASAAFVAVVTVILAQAGHASAQTAITAGFRDLSYGTSANSTPTGEKPESKLWWNDGSWWGTLFNASAGQFRIYRFNPATESWGDSGAAVDTRANTKADALWDSASNHLYIVSHVFTTSGAGTTTTSQWGRLYRFTYSSSQKRYSLDSGFPVTVTKGKSETLTIAKDSVGRLWVTYVEGSRVKVNWSRTTDLDWGDPTDLPVSTTAISTGSDDISAIVAFGGNAVGVVWSNQATVQTYFSYRRDTDPVTSWQAVETVLPGAECSGACTDDHFNVKADQQGRLFVATKTSLSSSALPLAMLAVRSAGSSPAWSSYRFGLKSEHHTRPIVLLDETANRLYMFATSGESGGAIYMKSSPMDAISFPSGLGQPVIQSASDTRINNVTSTKQNVTPTTGILVAASDQDTRFYFHAFLPLSSGGTVPAAPTGLGATAVSSTRVDLSWIDASSDEDSFSIERATGNGGFSEVATVTAGTTTYSDLSTAASTTYSYRVRARNAAGPSNYSNTATVTTPAVVTPPAAPTGLGATAVSATRVDLAWTDQSSDEQGFAIERATGGGSFGPIATVAANQVTFGDTTVSGSTGYSYRVRAYNGSVYSAYSNVASVTTPAGSPVRIKEITFEGGSLTGGTAGADKVSGAVTLETTAPLKGSYSARVQNLASVYLEESFTATSDLYVSFYIRLNALPTADARIFLVSNAGTTVGNIVLRTGGRLRLRADSTTVGADSAVLTAGQLYRVGVRQKQGASGDGVLEAYLAAADAAFGSPFASTSTGAWTTPADRVRFGATNTGAVDIVFDNVILDGAGMPGPSVQRP